MLGVCSSFPSARFSRGSSAPDACDRLGCIREPGANTAFDITERKLEYEPGCNLNPPITDGTLGDDQVRQRNGFCQGYSQLA